MKTEQRTITVEFTTALLGTQPMNRETFSEYIASKAPEGQDTSDEVLTISEEVEKGTTGFHKTPGGQPILYDYHCRGFFKAACGALRRVPGSESIDLKAYKKLIDTLVFIEPRQIALVTSSPIAYLERPLRAQTAQGERIALARSEMLEPPLSMTFSILLLGKDVRWSHIEEWLDYGRLSGLGQWRSASWGRFAWKWADHT